MANTKKSKSDEAQRKRDQREKDRKLREAESARKHQERKERKAKKDEGLAGKAKRAAKKIGETLGLSRQQADDNRSKPTHRERYAKQVEATNDERQRRRDEKQERAEAIAKKAGTRKPKAETQSAETTGGIDVSQPREDLPMFESDDVAALAGYPPDISEVQYENVVRKSALGF